MKALSRHGLKTSDGVLWCLAPGHFIVDPLGPVCWGVGPPGIRPAPTHIPDTQKVFCLEALLAPSETSTMSESSRY